MSAVFVLDACALLAILKDEPGADNVAAAYAQADSRDAKLVMNKINLFEVYYGFYRDNGNAYAEKILDSVRRSVVVIVKQSIIHAV
jgi:uncharacterized protein with PIN domain